MFNVNKQFESCKSCLCAVCLKYGVRVGLGKDFL